MCMRMLLLLLLLQLLLRSESYYSASTGFSRISSSSSSLLFPTRRSIRIMALNIEEQSSPTNAYSNSAQLKSHIFSLAATVDRGFGAKQQEREEILALIDKLKTMNPFPIPTYGLYDGKNDTLLGMEDGCYIEGTWKMVYTTALDVLSLAASPFTLLQGIYQVIKKDGSSMNIIDLAPRAQALLPVNVNVDSTLRLQVKTKAKARSSTRVGLTFLGVKAAPQTALGIDVTNLLPPIGFNFPSVPTLFGGDNIGAESSDEEGPGYFDILYLDDDCLIISQNEPGGIFVNIRAKSNIEID